MDLITGEHGQTFIPSSDSMVRFKKMEHVRLNRGRIFDWFVEICATYNQGWQTLWGAMGILDRMIIEKGKVKSSNIHLYGVTSIFMASKYHERKNISLGDIIDKVAHRKFTKEQILYCES
jgi:cyclin A